MNIESCLCEIIRDNGLVQSNYMKTTHFCFVSPQWQKIFYAEKSYLFFLPFIYKPSKDKGVLSGIGRVIPITFLREFDFITESDYVFECLGDSDLGQWGADRVSECLTKCGYDVAPVYQRELQTQGVDLIATRGRNIYCVECKTCLSIAKTGNIFLEEFRPRRKEETILATKQETHNLI